MANPSSKYKNNKPTLTEFGLKNTDIDALEREKQAFDKVNKTKSERISSTIDSIADVIIKITGYISIFSFTILIIMAFLELIFKIKIPMFWIYFFLATLGLGIALSVITLLPCAVIQVIIKEQSIEISDNYNSFSHHNLYQELLDYKRALKEYDWWQRQKSLEYWFGLSGRQFEWEIANLFARNGYQYKVSKQGGDGGIDILLQKGYEQIAVQCKAHKNKISPSVARDLLGTMQSRKIGKGMLVTLKGGTSGTLEFCKNNNIDLLDVEDIIELNDTQK